MCNKIKCAGQYTVDLINNNISRDVQEICIAAMMEHSGILLFVKLSHVDVEFEFRSLMA